MTRRIDTVVLVRIALVLLAAGASVAWASQRHAVQFQIDQWATMSRQWFDEPSGFASSNLAPREGAEGPLLVGVDDDANGIFVFGLRSGFPSGDRHVAVHWFIPFDEDERHRLSDLEAITFDSATATYYALTSHRRIEKKRDGQEKDKHADERRLISFRIEQADGGDYSHTPPTVYNLVGPSSRTGFINALHQAFGEAHRDSIRAEDWTHKKDDSPLPYAVELEGIAFRENRLYLGVKTPVIGGKSFILPFDPETATFGEAIVLDLGGDGISELLYYPPCDALVIAGNPPKDGADAYGSSKLYFLSFSSGQPRLLPNPVSLPHPRGKLEAMALAGENLLLGYDGEAANHRIEPVSEVFRGLACQKADDPR